MHEQLLEIEPKEEDIISTVKERKEFLYDKGNPKRAIEAYQRVANKFKELGKKYPNSKEYYLFHALSGSTANRRACPYFDFPGDDSIAKLVDDLYREYKGEE